MPCGNTVPEPVVVAVTQPSGSLLNFRSPKTAKSVPWRHGVSSVVVALSVVGSVVCVSSMPAQNLVDRHPLKILNMEPTKMPSNNSHQELMSGGDDCDSFSTDPSATSVEDIAGNRTLRRCYRISVGEWLTIIILCFVNLINYMDRFTIAGKATVYISVLIRFR